MARDTYHDVVVEALKKDGWTITNDPFYVQAGGRWLRIDIGAERLIGAEKDGEKIAVEIKSFIGISALHEFYKAVGQFDYYSFALDKQEKERTLFLAVPNDFYEEFVEQDIHNSSYIEDRDIHLIVYDIESKIILQWIR